MIDEHYTMRCDHCYRYLRNEFGMVAEYGDKGLLLKEAEEQGWRVWESGHCYCNSCREKADEIQ